MLPSEFDFLLRSFGAEFIDCQVSSHPINSQPDPSNYQGDPLGLACADLRNTLIFSDDGHCLAPIGISDVKVSDGFVSGIFRAWNEPKLREGYLPTTPRKLTGVSEVAYNWLGDRRTVTYQLLNSRELNPFGFIGLEIGESEEGLAAWISYGAFPGTPGYISKAVGVLLKGLREEFPALPLPIRKVRTSVSERNAASIRVLGRNGFERDSSVEPYKAPVKMGGNSYTVNLLL